MSAQITTTVRQVGATTSEGAARQHRALIDRPEAKGGADRGPMGGELMLIGVGGCFMSNLLANARAAGVTASDLAVEVLATMDGTPARFSALTLRVSGSVPADQLHELGLAAEQQCLAINTLRGSVTIGIEVA